MSWALPAAGLAWPEQQCSRDKSNELSSPAGRGTENLTSGLYRAGAGT